MQTFAAMNAAGELKTGYADLLRMAIPISVGTMLQFFVLLTDNFFLARLSEQAINGAGNAGLVYMTLEMIAVGSAAALQIVIARRIGEGRRDAALQTFRTGLLLHGLMGLSLMGIGMLLNSGPVNSAIADPGIRAVFTEFFAIRLLGFIPFTALLAFNALYTGTAKTWPILAIGACSATINIVLDAAWVEGWWGVEAIGATGAAWASFCAESTGFLIAMALTLRVMPEALRPWSLLSWEDLRAWWKLAYPLIGQFLTTVSTWTAFFFFVEKVGSLELKVSHVTRNFFMLAFIVTQGMQQTTRTYVSGLLGAGRLKELDQTLRRLFTLTFIGILLLCHGYILYPDHLAAVFFTDAAGQEAMVKTLHLLFIAVCTYAFTGIMLSTIQGSGATNVAFRVELAAVTIYMVVAAALTLIWPQPIWVIWRVELVYFSSIGLGSWLYLRKGTWRHITQPS